MLLLHTRGKRHVAPMRGWLDYLSPAQEERVLVSLGLTVDQALALVRQGAGGRCPGPRTGAGDLVPGP